MTLWTGIAVYFVIWWIVIFAILPWGVRGIGSEEVAKGHASGAPERPRVLIKMLVTTVVAAVIWLIIYLIGESGWISFRE